MLIFSEKTFFRNRCDKVQKGQEKQSRRFDKSAFFVKKRLNSSFSSRGE